MMSELKFKTKVHAPIQKVWQAWTDPDIITKWFSPHANIEPKKGGAFELFFDPTNHEHQCTKGCKITRFEPQMHLSFSWRGPDEFHHVMDPENPQTHVHVSLKEIGADTEVTITHNGWRTGKDWKEAKDWHLRAWTHVINSFEKFFNEKSEHALI